MTTSQSSNPKQIPYHEAWDLQKCLVEHQLSRIGKRPKDLPLYDQFVPSNLDQDISDDYVPVGDAGGRNFNMHNIINNIPSSFSGCDSVIILEHDPVYTLGTASDPSFIHGFGGENKSSSIPVVRIERGGEVTYHGPGQLTVYPILDLRGYKQDIHWYMRALEEVIIIALEKAGVKGVSFNVHIVIYSKWAFMFSWKTLHALSEHAHVPNATLCLFLSNPKIVWFQNTFTELNKYYLFLPSLTI